MHLPLSRKTKFSFVKEKAAQLGAAFFILAMLAPSVPLAADKKTENYKDIIEKAENLSLQKDRQQAIVILVQAMKRENPNGKIYFDLKKELTSISNLFYSEKTQQLYELAISMRKTDFTQAQQKIQEALRLEPDNLTLIIENARLQIAKSDCAQANEGLQKYKINNPFDELLLLTQAQASLCMGDIENFFAIKSQSDQKKNLYVYEWMSLDLERLVKEKNLIKARDILGLLLKQDKGNPENLYWTWKLDFEQQKSNKAAAEQYLTLCKNIAASQYRKHISNALLCRRAKDVEIFLKKTNGTN